MQVKSMKMSLVHKLNNFLTYILAKCNPEASYLNLFCFDKSLRRFWIDVEPHFEILLKIKIFELTVRFMQQALMQIWQKDYFPRKVCF